MASEIRVNKINSRTGVGTITLSPTGVDFTGITTVATLKATTGIVTTLSATGDVTIGDKIIHDGDTNTAIRFPAADTFTVETAGSERVRVDSSGNFGVGTNSPNAGLNVGLGGNTIPVAGASTGSALFGNATGGNAYGLVLGATSGGAGYIAAQRADGTSTTYNLIMQPNGGSIGVGTDSPTSQSGKTLHLHNGGGQQRLHLTTNNSGSEAGKGLDIILEHNTDGDAHILNHNTNGDLKLGAGDAERLRILSDGGLTFNADTAQANALDDYEEGTFTAACDNSVTLDSSSDLLQYVKIGSSVTVMGQIRVNSSNSGSSLTINNLPFTVASSGEGSAYSVGAVRLYSADMASDHKYVICIADGGSTNLQFQGVRDNATSQGLGATDNGYYMFGITYRTTT